MKRSPFAFAIMTAAALAGAFAIALDQAGRPADRPLRLEGHRVESSRPPAEVVGAAGRVGRADALGAARAGEEARAAARPGDGSRRRRAAGAPQGEGTQLVALLGALRRSIRAAGGPDLPAGARGGRGARRSMAASGRARVSAPALAAAGAMGRAGTAHPGLGLGPFDPTRPAEDPRTPSSGPLGIFRWKLVELERPDDATRQRPPAHAGLAVWNVTPDRPGEIWETDPSNKRPDPDRPAQGAYVGFDIGL